MMREGFGKPNPGVINTKFVAAGFQILSKNFEIFFCNFFIHQEIKKLFFSLRKKNFFFRIKKKFFLLMKKNAVKKKKTTL